MSVAGEHAVCIGCAGYEAYKCREHNGCYMSANSVPDEAIQISHIVISRVGMYQIYKQKKRCF
jgi:hypothetical protein